MKALRFLASRWVLSFVGVAILAMLVWFFGPLLPLLEGWVARLVVILCLLVVWAAANVALDFNRRRRERKLESGVAEKAADEADDRSNEEAAALRDRMSTALSLLKRARGTRGYLYEQPWYVIIGPPGAGKTTALLNSGLKFPLAAEMGQGSVAGVGGTRLCDWWFTENAVLIDTAGRYTTQDSNAAVDRAGWDAFLDLLRRTRPRQPLNGVIVAIALSDIASAPNDERVAHARAVRRRVKELEERLGIRLPVYLLFTKADLIAGFAEFFDDLDRERREQVWGVTFPFGKAAATPVGQFPEELQLLVDSLNDRLFDRLQAEQSPERRALIAGFPTQIATLAQPLQGFLSEAFGGSRLDPAPLLRGVYFASGTQEGSPIDRLTGVMMRAFGLDQRRAAALRPVQGRSYFLGQLVARVIFGEAMLVSEPPTARMRRLILRSASYAVVALLTLGVAGWLVANRSSSQREITEMAAARGVDAIVDAAHSVGQLDFKLPALGASFVGFNLHKWIGAPLGVGGFYIAKDRIPDIDPHMADLDDTSTSINARVHSGTANFAATMTVPDAIDFQEAIGGATKEARLRHLRNLWAEELRDMQGLEILTPADPRLSCGITSFRFSDRRSMADNEAVARELLERFKIFTVARDGLANGACVRVTPALFNSSDDIARLTSALRTMSKAA